MKKKNETYKQITCPALFSYIVDKCKNRLIEVPDGVKLREYYSKYGFTFYDYLKEGSRYVYLATKMFSKKPQVYVLDKCGEKFDPMSGCDYYGKLRMAGKMEDGTNIIVDLSEDPVLTSMVPIVNGKFLNKQSGILKSNPKYLNKWTKYYEYDLNSAYACVIHDTMPDTRYYRLYGEVKPGKEIGFVLGMHFTLVESGYADIIFPLVETPDKVKRFLDRWYKRKCDHDPRYFAKHCLVQCIGYLQYKNPFLRAYIVEKCNKNMQNYVDSNSEDWILVNTDAIYLTKEINVDLGSNIGQFKVEEGNIRTFNTADYETDTKLVQRGLVQGLVFKKEGDHLWLRNQA